MKRERSASGKSARCRCGAMARWPFNARHRFHERNLQPRTWMKSVTLGGSVVLSTGASVGVHVQLRVPRLTTAEKDELESTTIMLRCLTVVKA